MWERGVGVHLFDEWESVFLRVGWVVWVQELVLVHQWPPAVCYYSRKAFKAPSEKPIIMLVSLVHFPPSQVVSLPSFSDPVGSGGELS